MHRYFKYLFLQFTMRRKILHQSIKWLLPLLFIFFINGKTFFTHNHYINDTIVVHSHPFKKSEKTTHSHTTKELIAIEHHTHGFSPDAIIPHLEINSPFFTIVEHEFIKRDKIFFSEENQCVLLRAPPYIS